MPNEPAQPGLHGVIQFGIVQVGLAQSVADVDAPRPAAQHPAQRQQPAQLLRPRHGALDAQLERPITDLQRLVEPAREAPARQSDWGRRALVVVRCRLPAYCPGQEPQRCRLQHRLKRP